MTVAPDYRWSCECPAAYLVQTEADGAHCKAADTAEAISELYEGLPGEEIAIEGRARELLV